MLRNNLLVSALIFAVLEFWRPYFFLTDDNLDGGFPFFTEMGQHLLGGPLARLFRDHLFGGHYDLLRDPTLFCLASALSHRVAAGRDAAFTTAIIDVDAFVLLMLATAGFVTLAYYLRREMALTISDGWIMFYTLSFTYTMIALTTGASWLNFLGNHSALPWLALGILQKRSRRRGTALVALFQLHQILGGHLAPTVSNSHFSVPFCAGHGPGRRSWLPLALADRLRHRVRGDSAAAGSVPGRLFRQLTARRA